MIIKEARIQYNQQIKACHEQQSILQKQKQELEHKINTTPDGKNVYANEAATLELTIEAINEKKDEYQEYMDKLLKQWSAAANMVSAEQQGDADRDCGT